MIKEIYLAGGCFWGVEAYFKNLQGVITTHVGYANSAVLNPSYKEVCTGNTKAAETTYVSYDSSIVNLDTILDHFFRIINPYSLNRQGNDVGSQYRTGIYYIDNSDITIINNFINRYSVEKNQKIVVETIPLENYFKAEEYHQDYLTKNPNGYCHIDLSLLKESERKQQQ